MLRRWGKTRRGELADAGGAGTAAGTHGVVAQRRSRLLAPLSHELLLGGAGALPMVGSTVITQEERFPARFRIKYDYDVRVYSLSPDKF